MRTTCNYCLTVPPAPSASASQQQLKACTACHAAVYCNAGCQRAHWKAGGHKAECGMFARVRTEAGRDWLPTPVRAVAAVLMALEGEKKEKKEGGGLVGEAFGEGEGALEGNVEGFRADGEVWADFGLQARAAVAYSGLGDGMVEMAREVLCKVGFFSFLCLLVRIWGGGEYADGSRYKRMRLIGWMRTRAWRASFWMLRWPWSTTLVCRTRLSGLTRGRRC
jgi:SET and MYND domain-containing protein